MANVASEKKLMEMALLFMEGKSIRATVRETGIAKNTVGFWWHVFHQTGSAVNFFKVREELMGRVGPDKVGKKRGPYKKRIKG